MRTNETNKRKKKTWERTLCAYREVKSHGHTWTMDVWTNIKDTYSSKLCVIQIPSI